jgi:crotonobetaine/carnitine-CoA ligase
MPDATIEAWRGLWHHTGDAGWLDPEGNLYFQGRLADVIRRRGENISAQELEELILAHPDIADAAAVGVPSELTEEDIKIIVVPTAGSHLDPQQLAQWMNTHLPRFMRVRYIEVAPALPRTGTQKVKKTELRLRWRNPVTWDTDCSSFLPDK